MLFEIEAAPEAYLTMRGRSEPRAVVLAPTRELATQIYREAEKFAVQSRAHL